MIVISRLLLFGVLLLGSKNVKCQNNSDSDESSLVGESSIEPRIIGGNDANKLYSFVARITSKVDGADVTCGGAYLKFGSVLTAASCLENDKKVKASKITVEFRKPRGHGTEDWTTKYSFDISPSSVVFHPDFDPAKPLKSNIAIFKLPRRKKLPLIARIDIRKEKRKQDYMKTLYMAGWGPKTCDGPSDATNLQFGKADTIPNADCKTETKQEVTDNNICTKGPASLANNDVGSPLVSTKHNGRPLELIGVAAFQDCTNKMPDIFTKVSAYYDWIKEKSKE